MTREQWLEARKQGIGGSDCAAILGLSRYKTALDVYGDKIGLHSRYKQTEYQDMGHELESAILRIYEKRTGRKLRTYTESPEVFTDELVSIMLFSPDADVGEFEKIVDAKNVGYQNRDEWGREGTDDVPPDYLIQGVHGCGVMQCQTCDFAVLIGGNDFRIYTVKKNVDFELFIHEECRRFWTDYVLKKVPPPESDPSNVIDFMKRQHVQNNGKFLKVTPQIAELCTALATAKSEGRKNERIENQCKSILMAIIGDYDGIDLGTGRKITWKKQDDSEVIDWHHVALEMRPKDGGGKAYEELIERNTKPKIGARVFRTPWDREK